MNENSEMETVVTDERPVRQIISVIRRLFAELPEVSSVWLDHTSDPISVWVFTGNTTYNDSLMDKLIEAEVQVQKRFANTHIWFRYVPVVLCSDDLGDVTTATAQEIFSR